MKVFKAKYPGRIDRPNKAGLKQTTNPLVVVMILIAVLTLACSLRSFRSTPDTLPAEQAGCTDKYPNFQQLYRQRQAQGFDLREVNELLQRYEEACRDQKFLEAEETLGTAVESLERMSGSSSSLPVPEATPTPLPPSTPTLTPLPPSTPTPTPVASSACTDQFSGFQQLYEEKRNQGFDLGEVDEQLQRYEEACRAGNIGEANEILFEAIEILERVADISSQDVSQASPSATPNLAPAPVGRQKIVPPEKGVYLGAYNFEGTALQAFEKAIGKKVALVGYTPDIKNNGGQENSLPSFDLGGNERWYERGYITAYSLETGLAFPDPKFTPQDIIMGRLDNELTQVAQDIGRWGRPIFWLYPREPAIQPFVPPDREGTFHGGGYGPDGLQTDVEAQQEYGYEALYNSYQSPTGTSCDAVGDPVCLDGPERYKDMVRHIHDLVAPVAPNVTWVMGAISRYGDYQLWYPGNAYVDWHAIDDYQVVGDPGEPGQPAHTPDFGRDIRSRVETAIALDPTKPIMIVEIGVDIFEGDGIVNGDRGAVFQAFFQSLKQEYPQIKALYYFQLGAIAITENDPAATAWQTEVNGPDAGWWLSNVQTIPIP